MNSDKVEEDDSTLFSKMTRGVRPLNKTDRADLSTQRLPPHTNNREDGDNNLAGYDSTIPLEIVEPEEILFYLRNQLPHSTLRKFRRGELCSSMELDLHGLNSAEAATELQHFIDEAIRHEMRCFLLIHGKGRSSSSQLPILKSRVNQWLRQREEIIAFCSARQRDGGSGALYVLLKRNRSSSD